jgi:hypothetical protein
MINVAGPFASSRDLKRPEVLINRRALRVAREPCLRNSQTQCFPGECGSSRVRWTIGGGVPVSLPGNRSYVFEDSFGRAEQFLNVPVAQGGERACPPAEYVQTFGDQLGAFSSRRAGRHADEEQQPGVQAGPNLGTPGGQTQRESAVTRRQSALTSVRARVAAFVRVSRLCAFRSNPSRCANWRNSRTG